MKCKILVALWTAFWILFPLAIAATPVPSITLEELTENSEVIVVGRVMSITDEGGTQVDYGGSSTAARKNRCELKVLGQIKGAGPLDIISIYYLAPTAPIGYASFVVGAYGVVFLKRSTEGYVLVTPYKSMLPAPPNTPILGNSSALENVEAQLGNVLTGQGNNAAKQIAINSLSSVITPESTHFLEIALHDRDKEVQLLAAAYLLRRNDIAALPLAAEVLLSPQQSVPYYVRQNLLSGISIGLVNPDAVTFLSRLATLPGLDARRAATLALGHTDSQMALRPLAAALGDEDLLVRYNAVVGLSTITGQWQWRPNLDEFTENETKYMRHWREWSAQQRAIDTHKR